MVVVVFLVVVVGMVSKIDLSSFIPLLQSANEL